MIFSQVLMKNYADWHPYMKGIGGRLKNNCGHSLQLKILRQKPAAQPILVIMFGAAFLVSYCLVHTAAKPGNNWTKVKVSSYLIVSIHRLLCICACNDFKLRLGSFGVRQQEIPEIQALVS